MKPVKIFFLVLFLALLGGGVGAWGKIALREIPPLSFTALRFVSATAVLFLWGKYRHHKTTATKSYAQYFIPLLLTANVTLYAFGIRLTAVTTAQIMYTATPLIIALFSWLFIGQYPLGKITAGIAVGFFGVILALLPGSTHTASSLLGLLLIGCAVFSFSLYSVFSKKYASNIAPHDLIFAFSWMSAVITSILAISEFWSYPQWWNYVSVEATAGLVFTGLLGTAVYYVLHQVLVQKASPTMASTTLMLQPMTAFFWAFLFLGERMTLFLFFGMIFTIAGAWLVTSSKPIENLQI